MYTRMEGIPALGESEVPTDRHTQGGQMSQAELSESGRRVWCGQMPSEWPELTYEGWSATCDTLHAHTQVLGKLAVVLAPPEPQLQHAALRLTARGWETLALPAPDRSGRDRRSA